MKQASGFFRIAILLIVICASLFAYNHFLIDRSLDSIKSSLAGPRGQGDANALSVNVMIRQMKTISAVTGEPELESGNFSQHEYVLKSSNHEMSDRDAEFVLSHVTQSLRKRSINIQQVITDLYERITHFLQFVVSRSQNAGPTSTDKLLEHARTLELEWNFEQAANTYKRLLARELSADLAERFKLNLLSVQIRALNFSGAEETMHNVRTSLLSPHDLHFLAFLGQALMQVKILHLKYGELLQMSELVNDVSESFEIRYVLGIYELRLFQIMKAEQTFQKLISENPPAEISSNASRILSQLTAIKEPSLSDRT